MGTGRSPRPAELDESIQYQQFDASDAVACVKFWEQIQSRSSDSEICLVNNAGGYANGGLLSADVEDFDKQIKSNYFSGVFMTRGLAATFESARILNVISNTANNTDPANSAYGASKAASKYFFQALQQEFEPSKYRITNLYPGDIATSGPNPGAIDPSDLAEFILSQADAKNSYFLKDVTLLPNAQTI